MSINIVQITDFHIFADPEFVYKGILPTKTLQRVLAAIEELPAKPDLLLATGDLVSEGDPEGYHTLSKLLGQMGIPVAVLPGNHDIPENMQQFLAGEAISYGHTRHIADWTIIMLDSTQPGMVPGRLSPATLQSLLKNLTQNCHKHVLVALHHHPVLVNSSWMDTLKLENSEEFLQIIDAHPQVRGVVFGHVHQEFNGVRGDIRLLGAPSTGLQFAPGTPNMVFDAAPPGYRLLQLHEDGNINTRVVRV